MKLGLRFRNPSKLCCLLLPSLFEHTKNRITRLTLFVVSELIVSWNRMERDVLVGYSNILCHCINYYDYVTPYEGCVKMDIYFKGIFRNLSGRTAE